MCSSDLVDMIIQNVGVDGTTDFSFTVHRNEFAKAMDILKGKVQPHIGARDVVGDNKAAKVSVVGVGMRSHVGIASKMFRTLAEEGINIQMISSSEIKISVVIDEKYQSWPCVCCIRPSISIRKTHNRLTFRGGYINMRGLRRGGREVEGTTLLRAHTSLNLYRGFESLLLRQGNL